MEYAFYLATAAILISAGSELSKATTKMKDKDND